MTVKEARWHMSGIMGCHGFFDAKYDCLITGKTVVKGENDKR